MERPLHVVASFVKIHILYFYMFFLFLHLHSFVAKMTIEILGSYEEIPIYNVCWLLCSFLLLVINSVPDINMTFKMQCYSYCYNTYYEYSKLLLLDIFLQTEIGLGWLSFLWCNIQI